MWVEFWAWLGALPASSASFVGSLTGATFGLGAIIVGALFNACLNVEETTVSGVSRLKRWQLP
jgi:hypothetical protein